MPAVYSGETMSVYASLLVEPGHVILENDDQGHLTITVPVSESEYRLAVATENRKRAELRAAMHQAFDRWKGR